MVESDLFLDEYPRWDLGTPHQPIILCKMFLHAAARGQKEAECMCHQGCRGSVKEPNPEMGQSALQLIGYCTSPVELRDVYHSIYLLNRAPGFPFCRAAQRRMAIQEILSSLQERLRRRTSPDRTEDLPNDVRGLAPPQSYKAALWAACQKMIDTAAALQSDLDRLDNKSRGRSRTRSQSSSQHKTWFSSQWRVHSRSRCWAHSQIWLENRARSPSQDHCWIHLQSELAHSPTHIQELPHRWVSFCMPEGGDETTEREKSVTKLTVEDLETWLEHQVGQLGTPTWWRELEAIPDIKDPCKFARKIWASFYVPEVWSWMNPGQPFSMPPAPRNLNRGAFHPKRLEYQDVRQRPTLLTMAYCRCLQHWAEKHYPPMSPEARPLAKSMRELQLAVGKFMHIRARDILEGLNMNQPKKVDQPPFTTLFSRVLSSPVDKQDAMLVPKETHQPNVVLRLWGRAQPFPWIVPTRFPVRLPRVPTLPTFPPAGQQHWYGLLLCPNILWPWWLIWICQYPHSQIRSPLRMWQLLEQWHPGFPTCAPARLFKMTLRSPSILTL